MFQGSFADLIQTGSDELMGVGTCETLPNFSHQTPNRPRGLSLRIVHSLVSAIVHLAVRFHLQDLRELWRIGANCNYRCNYKPIWLTWRSGGLPTPILPLLDGSGQDYEGDQTGPGNESGKDPSRSSAAVHRPRLTLTRQLADIKHLFHSGGLWVATSGTSGRSLPDLLKKVAEGPHYIDARAF